MKKFLFILLIISLNSFGQTQEEKDSVVNEMCKTLHSAKRSPDSVKLAKVYRKNLSPYLEVFPEAERDEIWSSIYFRLQRNCPDFKNIIDKMEPQKGDWQTIDKKPVTKLEENDCKKFNENKNMSYLEHSGDTVHIEIENGYWIDHFKDGTYSKLSFKWIDACEFEIEFVESNNESRKKFSKIGDKYRYQVNDMKPGYYDMIIVPTGTETIMSFKIYY